MILLHVNFLQSDQDSNFGKPWFHGSISREEANEQLMRSKEPELVHNFHIFSLERNLEYSGTPL